MAKKAAQDTFHIYAKVSLETSIAISAKDLEEALQKSKTLTVDDFVDIIGENCDNKVKITGIYEQYSSL